MSDVYAFWRAALKDGLPIQDEKPRPGLWKARQGKDGPLVPVQIWLADPAGVASHVDRAGLTLAGTIAGKPADAKKLNDVWLFCKPVTKADRAHYDEHGVWPGEVPSAAIGDNSGDVTPLEELSDAVESASSWIAKTAIRDQAGADMASNFRAKLLKLVKAVDGIREAEKAPHLAAGKAVDMKYKPKIEAGEMAADHLRRALTDWMRAEEAKKAAEADKKHREAVAAAAAERARIEAERAAKMASDPIAALTDPEPELPMAPPPPEPVKVQAGGQSGRKTGFRSVTRYVVNDYAAALEFVKDHAKVKAAVQEVAAAMAKAGAVVPGVEAIVEKVAA